VFVVSHVSVVGVATEEVVEVDDPVMLLLEVFVLVAVDVVLVVCDIKLIAAYAPAPAIITIITTTMTIVPTREIPSLLLKRFILFFQAAFEDTHISIA
jgi:hypothetical protein